MELDTLLIKLYNVIFLQQQNVFFIKSTTLYSI